MDEDKAADGRPAYRSYVAPQQQDEPQDAAVGDQEPEATPAEPRDRFAAMQGDFHNAVDELGSSYELKMAKSHIAQAMAWIERHLHPSPVAPIPEAPPVAPPRLAD